MKRWLRSDQVDDGKEEVKALKQAGSLDVSADNGLVPGFNRLFATKSTRDTSSAVI